MSLYGHGVLPLADLELDMVRGRFPAWRISRMATMLRADKNGHKSRFAETAELLAVVLANAEFGEHLTRVSSHTCPTDVH